MILRRLGNKSRIAEKIQTYFPEHTIYVEPFFGAGGMFFNKPKSKYNFLNDIDEDVYNLFRQIIDNKEEFTNLIEIFPVTEKQFKEWNKKREETPMLNALRFIILSNFGYMGKPNTLNFAIGNSKKCILDGINETFKFMSDVKLLNGDFRDFFKKISFRHEIEKEKAFIYADPPYLGTTGNYSHSFSQKDSVDLFDCLQEYGVKFAMSEFDNDFIISQAKERNLNIIEIGERQNVKNRRTEILITNYRHQPSLFD